MSLVTPNGVGTKFTARSAIPSAILQNLTGFISFYRIRNLNLNLTATEKAVGKQTIAAVKQAEITEQSVVIQAEKADAEEALQEALPALEAARLALADLEKNDITEIRSFATPPEAVQVSNEDEKGVH